MDGSWSERAWSAVKPVYDRIMEHPFVVALADGTLSQERFIFYLRQDALYLDSYARRLAHVASRLHCKAHAEQFIRFASDGIEIERALHGSFLGGEVPPRSEMSPACLLYTSVLDSQATAPVEVEAAAVLPCFVVYQRVGASILARSRGTDNPYMRWIETYGDEAFADATARAAAVCDELAAAAGESLRARMDEAFALCTRMEWMFWDSAWRMEQWEI